MDNDPSQTVPKQPAAHAEIAAFLSAAFLGAAGTGSAPSPSVSTAVIAAGVLLLLSAALSAAEAALFSLGSDQVESLERQGRYGSVSARALLTFRDETLMTILLATYLANMGVVICLVMAASRLAPNRPAAAVFAGAGMAAAVIVIFGQYLPRALGHCFNVRVVLMTARPIVGLTFLVAPLRWLVLAVSNAVLGLPSESLLEREVGSEEEMKALITAGNLSGGLEEDERELISGVVEFGSTLVGEIMTPRPEIVAFPSTTPHQDMLRAMRGSRFSRVPIFEGTLDQVVGILHVKDLLLDPQIDYRDKLRKPLVVPETKGLADLLREFRRLRVHLAVICDEFGQTAGIVTMHDLLEEIVGELTDENRVAQETIRRLGPDLWLVSGRMEIDELQEHLGLDLSEHAGRTVSGFVTNRLGRIPAVGDTVEADGFRLTVERMGVRRVALLRVEKTGLHKPVGGKGSGP